MCPGLALPLKRSLRTRQSGGSVHTAACSCAEDPLLADALKAITEVTATLQHSLARLENLQKLMELQRELVGVDSLVAPGRVSGAGAWAACLCLPEPVSGCQRPPFSRAGPRSSEGHGAVRPPAPTRHPLGTQQGAAPGSGLAVPGAAPWTS